jgi:hypothetical protein
VAQNTSRVLRKVVGLEDLVCVSTLEVSVWQRCEKVRQGALNRIEEFVFAKRGSRYVKGLWMLGGKTSQCRVYSVKAVVKVIRIP